MDAQVLRIVGSIAGLAGIAIGMILLLYREIVRKNIFPTLTRSDAYKLLRTIAVLSWSIAIVGIFCWVWSNSIVHPAGPEPPAVVKPVEPPVIAGTVVDLKTNAGIGHAAITIAGQTSISEDSGNFRVVLPATATDRVSLSATHSGYFDIDQSVVAPTHDLILQMRPR